MRFRTMTTLYFSLLVLVFVTVTAASSQNSSSNLNENDLCATRFAQCERDLFELRKQRERSKGAMNELRNRLWRLGDVKKFLDREIKILRHQVEHPNEPVPHIGVRGTGPGLMGYPKDQDVVTPNCQVNLDSCENSKPRERNRIQDFEDACSELRTSIAEQIRIHNDLRATAAALKTQLASLNVTPHPSSQNGPFRINSSNEYDIDNNELERSVNASVDRIHRSYK